MSRVSLASATVTPHRRRIALTGGIASGKSTVAELLARRGALVIDYDQLSHDIVAPRDVGFFPVVDEFGPRILGPDGSINRNALAKVVFADPQGRQRLEAILHPLIMARADELESQAPLDQIVVHDIPLLVEADLVKKFDVVIVTDLDPDEQVRRARARDGLTEAQVRARIAVQVNRKQRLAFASYVIDTSGGLEELDSEVDLLWRELANKSIVS